MTLDTPATIAVLGAGPIGLEAALYARFLGYNVLLLERGEIGQHVRQWGHVTLFTPFELNRSKLGLAAIQAHHQEYRPPEDHQQITGHQWVDDYLAPLAETDLLVDALHLRTEVVAVGRTDLLKTDRVGSPSRNEHPFRLLVRDRLGVEHLHHADAVIDASGVFAVPNWLGNGGMPAVGEQAFGRVAHSSAVATSSPGDASKIDYGIPDVLGEDRACYQNKRTLVVGSGYSAATHIVALSQLAQTHPQTEVIWAVRRQRQDEGFPIQRIEGDRLRQRDELAQRANAIASQSTGPIRCLAGTTVESITQDTSHRFQVALHGADGIVEQSVDQIIASVGYRGDESIFAELQVHQCYATGGPMKLAAALMGSSASNDCLDQTSCGPESLQTTEPNFYVLGSKSYGRNPRFLYSLGLDQIRDLFSMIAGRRDLDLYSHVSHLIA